MFYLIFLFMIFLFMSRHKQNQMSEYDVLVTGAKIRGDEPQSVITNQALQNQITATKNALDSQRQRLTPEQIQTKTNLIARLEQQLVQRNVNANNIGFFRPS